MTTANFRQVAQTLLDENFGGCTWSNGRGRPTLCQKFQQPSKNIDDCVTYILNYVKNSGCNGFTDGEIFGQAIHYYEEKRFKVGKPMNCQIWR